MWGDDRRRLSALEQQIGGNGQPGLRREVAELTSIVRDLQNRHAVHQRITLAILTGVIVELIMRLLPVVEKTMLNS